MISRSYIGRHIVIHDEDDSEIAQTTIVEHNIDYMTIVVRGVFDELKNSKPVRVLILAGDGVHEFKGKAKHAISINKSTEIALYNGRILGESRHAPRYTINNTAQILNLIVHAKKVPLTTPMTVFVANVSSSGVLFKAPLSAFRVGDSFEMLLKIGESETFIFADVVWTKKVDSEAAEYGCEFVFMQNAD